MPQEQSKKFNMPSGAILMVTPSDFKSAWGLTKAWMRVIKTAGLDLKSLQTDVSGIAEAMRIPMVLSQVVELFTNEEVENRVFECGARALWAKPGSQEGDPGEKVTRDLFDDPSITDIIRGDYPFIIGRILEVNCKPFLAQVLSMLPAKAPEQTDSEPQKSQST